MEATSNRRRRGGDHGLIPGGAIGHERLSMGVGGDPGRVGRIGAGRGRGDVEATSRTRPRRSRRVWKGDRFGRRLQVRRRRQDLDDRSPRRLARLEPRDRLFQRSEEPRRISWRSSRSAPKPKGKSLNPNGIPYNGAGFLLIFGSKTAARSANCKMKTFTLYDLRDDGQKPGNLNAGPPATRRS